MGGSIEIVEWYKMARLQVCIAMVTILVSVSEQYSHSVGYPTKRDSVISDLTGKVWDDVRDLLHEMNMIADDDATLPKGPPEAMGRPGTFGGTGPKADQGNQGPPG